MAQFQSLPGFREFYPEALACRNHVFKIWRQCARTFNFQEYDAPVLEPLELYKAKSGEEIENQLFSFTDKGGRDVALRPEMTPTVCRLVGAKANALKRPIKWFSIAEFYRYERAQRGRERAFYQFNCDIFGESGPEAEVELIALLIQTIQSFGLTSEDFYVRLSDRNLWFYYLEILGLDEQQTKAILSAIDKYEKIGDAAFATYSEKFGSLPENTKAKILEFLAVKSLPQLKQILSKNLSDKVANRLQEWSFLLGSLEAMNLGAFVQVDFGVVRGLAYYTGFVFEAFDRKGELRAIAGGGRYDDLVQKLGGPSLPAVGFAIGDVTMGLLLEQRGLKPVYTASSDIYVAIGGESARLKAFGAISDLRASGYIVEYPLKNLAFGKQFKAAAESGAKLTVIIGDDEASSGQIKLRNMLDRSEISIKETDILSAVRDFFN